MMNIMVFNDVFNKVFYTFDKICNFRQGFRIKMKNKMNNYYFKIYICLKNCIINLNT